MIRSWWNPVAAISLACVLLGVYAAQMKSSDIIKALEKAGWYEVRQKGSHKQFRHATKKGTVTVPHPKAEMGVGTIKSIEKQAGVKLR